MAGKVWIENPGLVHHVPSCTAGASRSSTPTRTRGLNRRKGDPAKLRIARQLRWETTPSLRWIANQLRMGGAGSLASLLRQAERFGEVLLCLTFN
jgi:hypothetical protein